MPPIRAKQAVQYQASLYELTRHQGSVGLLGRGVEGTFSSAASLKDENYGSQRPSASHKATYMTITPTF